MEYCTGLGARTRGNVGLKPRGWRGLGGELPNRLSGRASVPASPNHLEIPRRSGLARTLALPGNRVADLGNTPLIRRSAYWAGMRTEVVVGRSRRPLTCRPVRITTRWLAGRSLNVAG